MWHAIQKALAGNLRRRLLFSVAAIHAVMMSLFIWDLTVRQQEMILSQQTRLASALSQSVATSVAIWVQARDFAGIQEIVDAQKRYPELKFAMVTGLDGEVFAHTDPTRRGQAVLDLPLNPTKAILSRSRDLVDIATPAILADQQVGWVRIGIGQEITDAELNAIIRDGLYYTLAAILIGSLLAALMAKKMTNRLYAIQTTADAVHEGKADKRAAVEGDDEAATLARQFNRMLDRLSEREHQLLNSHEALSQKENSLAEAQRIAKLGDWEMRYPSRTLFWSDQALRIIEIKRENKQSISYDKFLEIVHPDERDYVREVYARSISNKAVFNIDHRLLMPDGRIKYVHQYCETYYDDEGLPLRSVGTIQDITERRLVEIELEQHRYHLEKLVEERTNDIATKNRLFEAISRMQAQFIREPNPAELFRQIVKEFVELTDSDLGFIGDVQQDYEHREFLQDYAFYNIPQDENTLAFFEKHRSTGFMFRRDAGDNLFNHVIKHREPVISNDIANDPRQGGTPTGHPVLNNFLGIPVWYGEKMVGEIGLANRVHGYDETMLITLQPVIEAVGRIIVARWDQLAKEQAEQALVEAKNIAESASEAKSNFLANMSHELRTPLNAILGMLYLALRNELPPNLRNQLGKARTSAHSLLSIINDILDLSKIEAGKLDIERIEFGLDHVLERVTDIIAPQATEKEIEFLIRYDTHIPPTLIGDPLRIGQVLINLCSNAVKFTEKGQVTLYFHADSADESQLTLRACVEDSGIGMSKELQSRLFTKFTQADQSSTRRFGGTGLGLAISKSLVEMMNGRIWVERSETNHGTTFCFMMPLGIAPQAQNSHRQAVANQAGPLLKDMRALVVDDNEVSSEILAEMLREFKMEIDIERSGAATLARLETQQPYDLVLLDWHMPGMNGDEVMNKFRRQNPGGKIPKFIMVTAYGREDVLLGAERAGANGFLVKPVSPSSLLDATLTALGRERVWENHDKSYTTRRIQRSHDFAGIKLLLVEDNEINREFAGELLRSENIEVDEARDGKEAVRMIQERNYDCVLMDIQMPVMDGMTATRQIRALGQTPNFSHLAQLPIIAMTALAMLNDAERSFDAGMNDYVTKPVEPERLMDVLAKWLPRNNKTNAKRVDVPHDNNISQDLLALKHLDAIGGVHRIGGKSDAYRRQLLRFRERYVNAVTELRRLIEEEGAQEAELYCHALKGVSGNIGATRLHQVLSEADALLKRLRVPDENLLNNLEQRFQEVIADIDSLSPSPEPTMAIQALKPDEIQDLLRELSFVLSNDLGAVENLLSRLRSGIDHAQWTTAVNEIAQLIDTFDLDEAETLITNFQHQLNAQAEEYA